MRARALQLQPCFGGMAPCYTGSVLAISESFHHLPPHSNCCTYYAYHFTFQPLHSLHLTTLTLSFYISSRIVASSPPSNLSLTFSPPSTDVFYNTFHPPGASSSHSRSGVAEPPSTRSVLSPYSTTRTSPYIEKIRSQEDSTDYSL